MSGIYEKFKLLLINAENMTFSIAFSLPRNVPDYCKIFKYNCKTRWLFFKLRTLSYILVLVIHWNADKDGNFSAGNYPGELSKLNDWVRRSQEGNMRKSVYPGWSGRVDDPRMSIFITWPILIELKAVKVMDRFDIMSQSEIFVGNGFRFHSAWVSGKAVVLKVFEGRNATQVWCTYSSSMPSLMLWSTV